MYTCTENYLSGKQQELAIDSGSSKKIQKECLCPLVGLIKTKGYPDVVQRFLVNGTW